MSAAKLNAIIVDPNRTSSNALKHAARVSAEFGEVTIVSDFEEAMAKSKLPPLCDIMFLSYRLERNALLEFLSAAKRSETLQDAALILVERTGDSTGTMIAESIAHGADSILCEPISPEGLHNCSLIAMKVKVNGFKRRVKTSIETMMPVLVGVMERRGEGSSAGEIATLS